MNESRTSDLTASVTSSNINESSHHYRDSSCYYTDDDNDDDAFKETDTLLRKTTMPKLTHVDADDVLFADEESVALNVWLDVVTTW